MAKRQGRDRVVPHDAAGLPVSADGESGLPRFMDGQLSGADHT
jgi:hypothetical protein